MSIQFAVRADAVRLCLPYISTEETRYYLNGVCFEPGPDGQGVLAIATDGHKLGVAYDEQGVFAEGGDKKPIVRTASLCVPALAQKRGDNQTALLGNKKMPQIRRWLVVRDQVAIVVLAETAEAALAAEPLTELTMAVSCRALIDGTFPDWRRVVPHKSDGDGWPAFNAKYLKAISGGYAKVAGAGLSIMRFTSTGAGSPLLINFGGNPELPEFFAMLMPMRWSNKEEARPAWLGLPEPEVKKGKAA